MPINYTDDDLSTGPQAAAGVAGSFDVSPEQAAKAIEHGPAAGIPPAVGMRSPELVAQQALHATQQGLIASSPPVAKWAATAPPAHVAVTKDDFPALGEVSRVLTAMKGTGDWFSDIAAAAGPAWQQLQTLAQKTAANPTGPEALNPLPAAGALANLIFSPMAGITEPLTRGLTASGAPLRDVYLQGPYAVKGLNTLPAPAPVLTDPADRLRRARDQVSAGVQLLLGTGKPGEVPLKPQAAAEEAATGGAVVPTTPPHPGVPPAGVHEGVDAIRTHVADVDAANVAKVQQAIAASQTHARSPQVMEAFLTQQTDDRTVSVDPDVLIGLAGEGHEPFPALAQDIHAAAVDGTPVEVPLSTYLTQTAGQPYAEQLNAATSFRPDGVSVDGAKEQATPAERSTPAQPLESPTDLTPPEAERFKAIAATAHSQLEEVVKAQRITELFTDQKALGMTKPQFERYGAAVDNAIAEAKDKLSQRAYDQIKHERSEPFKNAMAQHAAQVERELGDNRALVARASIAQGKGPLGEPLDGALKLDRDDQLSQHGVDQGLPDRYFKKGGAPVDAVASSFGYDSGADLIHDLVQLHEAQGERSIAQHTKDLVKEEATNRARTELGFDLSPDDIHQVASEAINSPAISDFLASELQALAKEAGLPFDKSRVKAYALDRFAQLPVKRALNIRQQENLAFRGAVRTEKALLKGDLPLAFVRKQQQYIHQLTLREAHRFIKEYRKGSKMMGRVAKELTLPNTSQDAVNWSKSVLTQLGVPVKANIKDLNTLDPGGRAFQNYVDEKNSVGAQIVPAVIPRELPINQTVQDYRALTDMLSAMLEWGRGENEVTVNGKRVALREQLDTGIAQLNRYTRNITEQELAHPNLLQRADALRRGIDVWLVRQEQLMRDFGERNPTSPFFQVVSKRLQERKTWENDQRVELAKHFRAVAKDVGNGFDKWLDTKLPSATQDLVKYADGSSVLVKNRDIMMAALHLGDEGALQAFTEGFHTTPELVEQAVMAHATPVMWKAVRGILDSFGKYAPQVEEMYNRVTGVTPELVPNREFKMADGTVNKGGYFPVRYNLAKMPKEFVRQSEESEQMLGSPRYVKVSPSNNYIKGRGVPQGPVDMGFRSIYSRLNQEVHDLAYREVLADMNKFLLHPEMKAAISQKYGPEYVDKIRQDIRDIAGAETRGKVEETVGRALDYVSEGQMVNMIGFSPKTMIKHGLTAQAQAISEVGAPRYAASMSRFALHPAQLMAQAEESGDIRHILSTFNEDAFHQYLVLSGKPLGLSRAVRSFAFHFVGASNYVTAVPLYDAAKRMFEDKHPTMSEADVQAAAGQLVRQALGSAGATDSPAALRMGGGLTGKFFRLTNPFLTFLSHMYNKQREIPQALGYAGEKVDIGRGLGILLASVIAPIYIEQAVTRGEFGFAKKVKDNVELWVAGLIHHEAGGIPILNSGIHAAMKKIDPKYPGGDDTISSIFGSFGEVAKDLNDTFVKHHPWNEKKLEHATIAGGYAFRAPGLALTRVENFLHELKTHSPTAYHDLIFGKGHKK